MHCTMSVSNRYKGKAQVGMGLRRWMWRFDGGEKWLVPRDETLAAPPGSAAVQQWLYSTYRQIKEMLWDAEKSYSMASTK